MFRYLKENPNQLLVLLLTLWGVLNIFTALGTELIGDEAYYWVLSQKLEWGYFDHPPLFALLTRLGVLFGGDSELGVRLFAILLQPLYLYLFWTIVRRESSDYRSALRYFALCFSMPIFQIYGFVMTPDVPLLMAMVLTLFAYGKFSSIETPTFGRGGVVVDSYRVLSAMLIGIGFAMMAYAKYQGIILVAAMVISDPKLLKNWRFYLAGLIAIALCAPHIMWQSAHDFTTLKYHLVERGSNFQIGYLWDFFVNYFIVYNPMLTIPFVIAIFTKNPYKFPAMDRLLRVLAIVTLLFFLYTTTKGHVQPQWMIAMLLPMVYFFARRAESSPSAAKYISIASISLGALMLAGHVLILAFNSSIVSAVGLSGKEIGLKRAEWTLKDIKEHRVSQRPVEVFVSEGKYTHAALFSFYTDLPAYAAPSLYHRSSHYEFLDMERDLYGKKAAIELSELVIASHNRDSLMQQYRYINIPTLGTIIYDVVDHYIPTRDIKITPKTFPEKMIAGQTIPLTLEIENPYPYEIPLSGEDAMAILVHMKFGDKPFEVTLPIKNRLLPADGKVTITTYLAVDREYETGLYDMSFTVQRYPFGSWYNSQIYEVLVVNPRKTRI